MKFETLHIIANLIGARDYPGACKAIDLALITEEGPQWQKHLGRLALFLGDPELVPFATIMAKGNGKLPFLAFSVLPGVSCPGAGDCLDFCYSFKSWRYPAAFVRQAQNLVLVRENRPAILADLDKYWQDTPVDFRLYVDGDFDSIATVNFWWQALADRTWLRCYGYSKSFSQILRAKKAPKNYRLNMSSGHKHTRQTVQKVSALECTRGYFVAVDMGRQVSSSDHGDKAHQSRLRKAYGRKAFTCPGKCGECTPAGHACGSARFNDIDIIIAAH